jgi:hypothetical protein
MVPKDLTENVRFRQDLLLEAGDDVCMQAQLRRMCSEDLLFYVNTFAMTYDPRQEIKVTPFLTYVDFQDETMLDMAACIRDGQDVGVPKSRDMGASWMGLTVIEWFWHFHSDLSFLLVSRNEDYVDKRGNPKALFWKVDFLHLHQPKWLLPNGRWKGDKDPGRKNLSLVNADNRSVIDGESTTGDVGRGDRRTAMFIDEHAAFDLNDGYRVLRATRDTTKCRIFNSTPQGAGNAFYEVVHKSAAKILRLHWSRHPEKNQGLYTTNEKTGKAELLDDFEGKVLIKRRAQDAKWVQYPEEYPFELDQDSPKLRSPWYDNECARCVSPQEIAQELDIDFLGSDFPFFDQRAIRLLKTRYARPPIAVVNFEYDRDNLVPKRIVEDKGGLLWLWRDLTLAGKPPRDVPYVIGADVSAGTGASNSVASVVERDTGEKIAVYRTPNMRPWDFAGMVIALCRFFNDAYLVPDASGPTGQTFVKRLIAESYGEVYFRKSEDDAVQRVSTKPGFFINSQSRAVLLEDYRAALGDGKFLNRSEAGLDECLQFLRKPDGGVEHSASMNTLDPSGARSAHGDEVIADALACVGVQEVAMEARADEPELPVLSLAWRRKQRSSANARAANVHDSLGDGW